jgi:hypothetical protein
MSKEVVVVRAVSVEASTTYGGSKAVCLTLFVVRVIGLVQSLRDKGALKCDAMGVA